MSAPTDPDSVSTAVNSGTYVDSLPGLSGFSGAWRALEDFTSDWAQNWSIDVRGFTDYVSGLNPGSQ